MRRDIYDINVNRLKETHCSITLEILAASRKVRWQCYNV